MGSKVAHGESAVKKKHIVIIGMCLGIAALLWLQSRVSDSVHQINGGEAQASLKSIHDDNTHHPHHEVTRMRQMLDEANSALQDQARKTSDALALVARLESKKETATGQSPAAASSTNSDTSNAQLAAKDTELEAMKIQLQLSQTAAAKLKATADAAGLQTPPTFESPTFPEPQGMSCDCEGSAAGTFVNIGRGNTCRLACASSWAKLFSKSSSGSVALSNEPRMISKGLSYMYGRHASICVIMRDGQHLIPRLRTASEKIASRFKKTTVIIVENDSVPALGDGIKGWISDMQRNRDTRGKIADIHWNGYHLRAPKTDRSHDFKTGSRFHMLSLMRNECLNEVAAMDDPVDIMITMDVDGDLDIGNINMDGVAHTFGLQSTSEYKWDAVCANGVVDRNKVKDQARFKMGLYLDWSLRFGGHNGRNLLASSENKAAMENQGGGRKVLSEEDSTEQVTIAWN